jgi:hypothetical protein
LKNPAASGVAQREIRATKGGIPQNFDKVFKNPAGSLLKGSKAGTFHANTLFPIHARPRAFPNPL